MANTIEVILKFTDQASKGFKTTKEQLSGIGDVAKSVGGTLQTVGSKLSGFGNAMTVGITAPVVAAGIASIKMASDYEESLNKMRVVFKDAAPVVEEFSKTAASALGMSSQEALSAAGTFGNLFTAMGIGESVSANMSIQLIKLASDLASFNNISPTGHRI